MIVSFIVNPTGQTTDITATYINFLRCVTAIATAPSGTTTLTVNPYTASNTINTGFNCIQSIHANADAGGWLTSTKHNVPSSGNNTAVAYTGIAANTWAAQYVADFYNTSTKSATPYKKLTFHTYNATASGNPYITGKTASNGTTRSMVNVNGAGVNILTTFGASTSTDWADTNYAPANNSDSNPFNYDCYNNKSYTLGANTQGNGGTTPSYNGGVPLNFGYSRNQSPTASGNYYCKFTMAVTNDYCIIWETPYNGDSTVAGCYASQLWQNSFPNEGTLYWNSGCQPGFIYCGLRTTQAWEDVYTNNVPWVCLQYVPSQYGAPGNTASSANTSFTNNQVAALMHTVTDAGALYSSRGCTPLLPGVHATINSFSQNYFDAYTNQTGTANGYTEGQYGSTDLGFNANYRNDQGAAGYGNRLDGPIWISMVKGNGGTVQGRAGATANHIYKPVVDPVSGTFVPPAVPITISKSQSNDQNAGGVIRGLYKSLGGTPAYIKQYWLSGSQTFTINGEQWWPFVVGNEMFLVRYA
jgi:hypothetical protein